MLTFKNEKMKQVFEEELQKLPEINRRALLSFDWLKQITEIGKSNGIIDSEIEDFQIETILVLVGMVSPNDYPNELAVRLALSPAQVESLLGEVVKKVFTPIHDYIVHGGEKKSEPNINFNPVSEINTKDSLLSNGIELTTEETPIITPEAKLVRTVGSSPIIPETKPVGNPIIFNPQKTTSPIPETTPLLSTEKLRDMLIKKKQIVDTTIENL